MQKLYCWYWLHYVAKQRNDYLHYYFIFHFIRLRRIVYYSCRTMYPSKMVFQWKVLFFIFLHLRVLRLLLDVVVSECTKGYPCNIKARYLKVKIEWTSIKNKFYFLPNQWSFTVELHHKSPKGNFIGFSAMRQFF